MGCFSWLRADDTNAQINLVEGDAFKVLIPKEFGGGFIRGHYDGYGRCIIKEDEEEYDLYELLAFWNESFITDSSHKHCWPHEGCKNYKLSYDGEKPLVPKITKYTDHNRHFGIDIGCYDDQHAVLTYPLKLVSVRYKGTYEDCNDFSRSDPDQGFFRKYRGRY